MPDRGGSTTATIWQVYFKGPVCLDGRLSPRLCHWDRSTMPDTPQLPDTILADGGV